MQLITQKELSRRLNITSQTLGIYFCRPEFLKFKISRNKIMYCNQVVELIKKIHRPRGKRKTS